MKAWAHILFLVSLSAFAAESPSPEATASPTPAASLSVERLFGSIRNDVSNFWNGTAATPAPTAEPVAAASPTGSPANAVSAVSSILSIKPEKPAAPLASKSGTTAQSAAPPAKVEFDDNQKKKTQDATDYGGGKEGGGANHQTPPSKVTGARGKPKAFDKWYPVCLFFDGVNGAANAITKGLTDMAAKCGVNLITYPVFVSGAGGGVNGVKNLAKQKCNATDGFGRFGVNRGSAILVTGNASLPQQMCGSGEVDHCGEMGWDVGQSLEARLSSTGRWGGAANGMAFGVALGTSLATVAAALGQTELGLPPGYGAGNGTGEDNEGYASAGSAQEAGWSSYGCQRMRETAFDNDGRWKYLEDRKFYAVPPKSGKLYDLGGGKPLFAKPKAAPAAGGGNGGGGGGGASPGAAVASSASSGSSGSSPASSAPTPGGAAPISAVAGGHQQVNRSSGTSGGPTTPSSDAAAGGRRELEDGSTVRSKLVITDNPGSSAGSASEGSASSRPRAEADSSSSTASVYYDDSAERPSSVGVTNYGTGGAPGDPQLLSAGGAAALKSQLDATASEGTSEPKEDESRSQRRPTEAANNRKPASSSSWDSVLNGDYFKKVFKPKDDGGGGGRRPRVVQ